MVHLVSTNENCCYEIVLILNYLMWAFYFNTKSRISLFWFQLSHSYRVALPLVDNSIVGSDGSLVFLDGSSPNDICEFVTRKNDKIIKVVTRCIVALKLNSQRGVDGSTVLNIPQSRLNFCAQ